MKKKREGSLGRGKDDLAMAEAEEVKTREGEEVKTRDDAGVEVTERGEIFFFYRPKVEKEEAHGASDVQRVYVVLRPESGEKEEEEKQDPSSGKEGDKEDEKNEGGDDHTGGHGSEKVKLGEETLLRLIIMGRKGLPDVSKRTRPYWGYVELVTKRSEDIRKALSPEEYDTATRGHRHVSGARPVGEGVYRLLRHKSARRMHTHLVYKLDLPKKETNGPQEAFNIEHEGSYIIQVKNPEQPAPPNVGLGQKRRAAFPASLQGGIGSYRFVPADPPDFLNFEGCEFILISASDDIDEELGLDVKADDEEPAKPRPELVEILVDQNLKSPAVRKPLFEGEWA